MLVTLHRRFDLAAPRLNAVRDRQPTGLFAGSSLPQPRRVLGSAAFALRGSSFRWLRGFASLAQVRSQRDSFRGLAGTYPMRLPVDPRMPSQRRALDALAHVHRAVHADLHIAGRSCSQGELRDP